MQGTGETSLAGKCVEQSDSVNRGSRRTARIARSDGFEMPCNTDRKTPHTHLQTTMRRQEQKMGWGRTKSSFPTRHEDQRTPVIEQEGCDGSSESSSWRLKVPDL